MRRRTHTRAATTADQGFGPDPAGVIDHGCRNRRPAPVAAAMALSLVLAGLVGGCTTSGPAGAPRRTHPTAVASPLADTVTGRAAAAGATSRFRSVVGTAASSLVGQVDQLLTDLEAGHVAAARDDEIAAQAQFDRVRFLVGGNPVNASAIDQRVADVPSGQTPVGLHAVERDLWPATGAPHTEAALADAGGLAAQAPVAEFLLSRAILDPEAIGTAGVDELGWVTSTALPGQEELYSHQDPVDVVATVAAAQDAFTAIQPLGALVDPSLTAEVAARFATLVSQVGALVPATGPPGAGPPGAVPVPVPVERVLTRQVDATAAGLSWLAAALAPFGTAGGPS